jgi:hypothetical protein
MNRRLRVAVILVGAAAVVAAPAAGAGHGPGRGNSWAAHLCNHGGYSLVGTDGTTFRNTGACVSFAVHGGVFANAAAVVSGQIVIPAGKVATISNAYWNLSPCDALTYGYQLDFGSLVALGSKPGGSCANGSLPGATVGPFSQPVRLRIFLTDTGNPATPVSCNYTFFSDGPHALVTGSNPWQIDIRDSAFCTEPTTSAFAPTGPGLGNLDVTVTVSG